MKLETYLTNKKQTQTAFAAKIGENQATLSRYMRGDRKVPLGVIAKVQAATNGAVKFKDWLQVEADAESSNSSKEGQAA